MRPQSIRNFDYLYLGSLALSVLGFVLSYEAILADVQRQTAASGIQMGSGLAIGSMAFGLIFSLALWFMVSRLGIELVKWILVVFFVFGLIGLPEILTQLPGLYAILSLLVTVMQGAALYFLFMPTARAWFAEKRGKRIE